MTWKTIWNDWKLIAVAAAMCVGAFFLYRGAWNIGYQANAFSLLGWHFLRFLLLIVAWAFVVSGFRAAVAKEKLSAKSGITVAEGIGALSIFLGCMGGYPLWPVVLLLMAPTYLAFIHFNTGPDGKRLTWSPLLRAAVVVVLFLLTWYFCASTTRQAMRGLGDRIEAKAGAAKLVGWATEVVAAHELRQQSFPLAGATIVGLSAAPQSRFLAVALVVATAMKNRSYYLAPDQIPDWVDDLLGPQQGVRSVMIEGVGKDTCVGLRTGGSAFHFYIRVCPTPVNRDSPLWWFGDASGLEQHGIYIETEGK
jgi:hypothetical protein